MSKEKPTGEIEPQKSSAARFITYIASTGQSSEKYELRYENENIWMSQKTMASVTWGGRRAHVFAFGVR